MGGQLNAAIANALVLLQTKHSGRGPTRARVFYREEVLVVVMEDVLTTAERNLVAGGDADSVLEMRSSYQHAMRADMVAVVEELTSRNVVAFMSDNHVDPDLSTELFVLDRPL
jgi:uncharacterized protein YbcI